MKLSRTWAARMILMALLLALWAPGGTQTPDPGEGELRRALNLADNGSPAEAVEVLHAISASHPGTELDAQAQL